MENFKNFGYFKLMIMIGEKDFLVIFCGLKFFFDLFMNFIVS